MALLNDFVKKGSITRKEYETFLVLLNPVAPHITEELWSTCGYEGYVYNQPWPEYDEAKTVENTIEMAVQINGKTRGVVALPVDVEYDEAKTVENTIEMAVQINGKTRGVVALPVDVDKETAIAKAKEVVADKLTGTIIKEIYVPKKIINIVQK